MTLAARLLRATYIFAFEFPSGYCDLYLVLDGGPCYEGFYPSRSAAERAVVDLWRLKEVLS